MRWWGRTRRSKRKNERRRCARRSHPEPFHSRLPALLHETHHGHTHATATRLDAGARTAVECCARHLPDRRVRSCRSSYRGSGTRGGSCRSAGRREGGGGVPLARHLPDRRVRSCRSSYRRAGTRGGSCRSAGRREGGGGVPLARHLPDRRVRSCRSSYRRAGTRGGSCRSAGRREGGGQASARLYATAPPNTGRCAKPVCISRNSASSFRGGANMKPWTRSQPMSMRRSSWASCSTPSATVMNSK